MNIFEDSHLLPEVIDAITDLGFVKPTEIQAQAIPFLLSENRDLIALAQTGTGKTAAFGLPLICQTLLDELVHQTLIICPTRELCLQIEKDIQNFGKNIQLKSLAVYGGASIEAQLKVLKRGVHFVVATPGRLVDIIKRRKVNLSQVQNVVLDEADEMLNMGFQEDIDTILEQTPANKRTLLFSATMPKEVRRIANNYMQSPFEITVGNKNAGADTVSHHVYMVHSKDKYIALKRVADYYPEIYGIVFCRTRQETKDIADKLMSDGYNADALHGDLSQAQRDYVMKKFRNKNLNMLVATDVAARGLDVQNLTHVINYSLPDDVEAYTHRSGRTGRAGNKGISIAITNLREKGKVKQIERIIKKDFIVKEVPGGNEICEVQLKHLIKNVLEVEVNEDKIAPFYNNLIESFDSLSKEELIKHFISFEFNRLLEYYEGAVDINASASSEHDKKRGNRRDREDRRDDRRGPRKDFTRFFINTGKKDDVDKVGILRLLNKHINDRDVQYGAIDVLKSFSFFEVDSNHKDKVLAAFSNAEINGKPLSVEVAQAPQGKSARGSKNGFIKGDDFQKNKRRNNNKSFDSKRPRRPKRR